MQKIRILVVVGSLRIGGQERVAGEMYDNVREDILKACSASGRR